MIRGMTPIGKCYSGLLGAPTRLLRKVALATPRALNVVLGNQLLQQNILELETRAEEAKTHLDHNGLLTELFLGWKNNVSLGIRSQFPMSDQRAYQQAKTLMISLERGAHRRLFFARMGVATGPEVAELSPHLYAAMLARLRDKVGSAGLDQIAAVQVWEKAFDRTEQVSEGKVFKFSRSILEREPHWSHPEEF